MYGLYRYTAIPYAVQSYCRTVTGMPYAVLLPYIIQYRYYCRRSRVRSFWVQVSCLAAAKLYGSQSSHACPKFVICSTVEYQLNISGSARCALSELTESTKFGQACDGELLRDLNPD
jgi:hypothetical protein